MYWQAPLGASQQMFQELVGYVSKTKGQGGVVGLGIRPDEITAVSHDYLWRSMMPPSVTLRASFLARASRSKSAWALFGERPQPEARPM